MELLREGNTPVAQASETIKCIVIPNSFGTHLAIWLRLNDFASKVHIFGLNLILALSGKKFVTIFFVIFKVRKTKFL